MIHTSSTGFADEPPLLETKRWREVSLWEDQAVAGNEIRFDYQQHGELDGFEIVPCIDSTPLTEMIDIFETDVRPCSAASAASRDAGRS